MKALRHSVLVLLGLASVTYAAAMSPVDVKVSKSSGKVVYTGQTDSKGNFTTNQLAAGSYVVQFNGSLKGGPYALLVTAGKEQMGADSVPAGKFAKGGVAMKISVGAAMSVTGQVAPAGTLKAAAAPAASTSKVKGRKTKMMNGHEYVWIPPEPGDWNGGKWVLADSIEARSALSNQPTKAQSSDN